MLSTTTSRHDCIESCMILAARFRLRLWNKSQVYCICYNSTARSTSNECRSTESEPQGIPRNIVTRSKNHSPPNGLYSHYKKKVKLWRNLYLSQFVTEIVTDKIYLWRKFRARADREFCDGWCKICDGISVTILKLVYDCDGSVTIRHKIRKLWRIVTGPSQSWTKFKFVTEIPSQFPVTNSSVFTYSALPSQICFVRHNFRHKLWRI